MGICPSLFYRASRLPRSSSECRLASATFVNSLIINNYLVHRNGKPAFPAQQNTGFSQLLAKGNQKARR
jgi:hypothetical protein